LGPEPLQNSLFKEPGRGGFLFFHKGYTPKACQPRSKKLVGWEEGLPSEDGVVGPMLYQSNDIPVTNQYAPITEKEALRPDMEVTLSSPTRCSYSVITLREYNGPYKWCELCFKGTGDRMGLLKHNGEKWVVIYEDGS
jgi:hypothetical protein